MINERFVFRVSLLYTLRFRVWTMKQKKWIKWKQKLMYYKQWDIINHNDCSNFRRWTFCSLRFGYDFRKLYLQIISIVCCYIYIFMSLMRCHFTVCSKFRRFFSLTFHRFSVSVNTEIVVVVNFRTNNFISLSHAMLPFSTSFTANVILIFYTHTKVANEESYQFSVDAK